MEETPRSSGEQSFQPQIFSIQLDWDGKITFLTSRQHHVRVRNNLVGFVHDGREASGWQSEDLIDKNQVLRWWVGVSFRSSLLLGGGFRVFTPGGVQICVVAEGFDWIPDRSPDEYKTIKGQIFLHLCTIPFLLQASLIPKLNKAMANQQDLDLKRQIDSITNTLNKQSINPYREATTVPLTPSMRKRQAELNSLSVVVKLLDGEMSFSNLRSALANVWYKAQIQTCKELERGVLQFWFKDDKSFKLVVAEQPWIVAGHILQLAAWDQYRAVGKECFRTYYVWMVLCNYPSGYIGEHRNGKTGEKIVIGNLVSSGFFTNSQIKTVQIHAAEGEEELLVRVRLSMHRLMVIPTGFRVPYIVDTVWAPFAFEFLPAFCYKCGVIGHQKSKCTLPEEFSAMLYTARTRVFSRPEGGSLLYQHFLEAIKLKGDAMQREAEFTKWASTSRRVAVSQGGTIDSMDLQIEGGSTKENGNTMARDSDMAAATKMKENFIVTEEGTRIQTQRYMKSLSTGVSHKIGSSGRLHVIRWEPGQLKDQGVMDSGREGKAELVLQGKVEEQGKRKGSTVIAGSSIHGVEDAADTKAGAEAKKRKLEGLGQSTAQWEPVAVGPVTGQQSALLTVVGTDRNQSQEIQ